MENLYGLDFKLYCIENNIGNVIDGKLIITKEEYDKINDIHPIIEITTGGLLIGKSHDEGGINMLMNDGDGNFEHIGEMEGMEYVTGDLFMPQLREYYLKLNGTYNSQDYEYDPEFKIPEGCNVYDLSTHSLPLILLTNGNRCIINKNSTQKLIHLLIESEKIYDLRDSMNDNK